LHIDRKFGEAGMKKTATALLVAMLAPRNASLDGR
jgi:hypothetical protein